jgi:FixJ family two-component response regulator
VGALVAETFEGTIRMEMTAKLSEREIQVLKLMVAGRNNRDIGTELNISRRTVEIHRAKMRMRMDLDTEGLIQYALSVGIVESVGGEA